MQDLKQIRKEKQITQLKAAQLTGISLRSYKTYENDILKRDTAKYRYLVRELSEYNPIDEEHGILSIDEIKQRCLPVFQKYGLSYGYLFGSYAKNQASETSDVDIIVSDEVTGLQFYGMVESFRDCLKKKVDILNVGQLNNNLELLNDILKEGIKIYG